MEDIYFPCADCGVEVWVDPEDQRCKECRMRHEGEPFCKACAEREQTPVRDESWFDEDGKEYVLRWDTGDRSVGIHPGWVCNELDALIDEVKRLRRIAKAAEGLLIQLKHIHEDSEYVAVWTLYSQHTEKGYCGPDYAREFASLDNALREGEVDE